MTVVPTPRSWQRRGGDLLLGPAQILLGVALLAPEGPLHAYPTINAAVRAFRASRGTG